jgi:pimeloyl-ACP methyl ester carboxylesterase
MVRHPSARSLARRALLPAAPLLLVLAHCAARPSIEEISFHSGPFTIVGDLRFPEGQGPFPAVVFVHGDGPNNRTSGVTYPPIMERMHRAGYATLAWDKPGTGASTGPIDAGRVVEQRAQIVLDAIALLRRRPDIDPGGIGLWGISQAGYVMPRVLERSDDVAFMIAVGCAGGPGVDQGIYLLTAQMICEGYPEAGRKALQQSIRAFTMAATYEEYVRHKAPLVDVPAFRAMARYGQRVQIGPEEDWHRADPSREYYGYDPMRIIERTTIPVLVFFGEKDTQVDPIQGAEAYRAALARAGNPRSRVEIVAGADHNILVSETGCIAERDRRSRAGWRSYAPGYLDTLEAWLRDLRR